jgi:hypothetical protein
MTKEIAAVIKWVQANSKVQKGNAKQILLRDTLLEGI